MSTKIEWTDETWNPTTGCTKRSPGCKHCYAETLARRLQAMGAPGYDNGFALALMGDRVDQPLQRRKPTRYFVNSMSDLFHEALPEDFLDQVFCVIERTPRHTYQVLIKRAERMHPDFASRLVPDNAWLGVSVEDRRHGLVRIEALRRIDARVRFLSAEPLLEDLGALDLTGIHQVIVGGESSPRARPMALVWVDRIHRQCKTAGAAFFFKQWGSWGPDGRRRSKNHNGRIYRDRTWDEMPDPAGMTLQQEMSA